MASRNCARAVGPEGEPRLQRAERPRVLQRDVRGVQLMLLMRQVPLLVGERVREHVRVAAHHDAARLRQVEPLMDIHGARVRAREPDEELRPDGRRRQPVRAVDVHPHAALLADVGDPVERIDGAGQRRSRRRDDRDRRHPRRDVAIDRVGQGVGPHPPQTVQRDRPQVVRADPEQLDRPRDRVVDLLGAVDGRTPARQTAVARSRERPLSRRGDRGEVADRPSAREGSAGRREADELRQPPDRLLFDDGRRPRVNGQVDVVRVRQEVGDRADLEPGRTDEREVARPRLRDRLVQDPRRIVEHLVDRGGLLGEPAPDQLTDARVERRLLRPEPVEAPPRLLHQLRRVRERLLARGVEAERALGLHVVDGTAGQLVGAASDRRSDSAWLAGSRPFATKLTINPITNTARQ